MKPIIGVIVDGEQVFREMTDAEHAVYQTEQAERLARDEAKAKAETDKASARAAVIAKLGLTADEVAALLS